MVSQFPRVKITFISSFLNVSSMNFSGIITKDGLQDFVSVCSDPVSVGQLHSPLDLKRNQ
jgi:hypothetical protein